MRQAQPQGRAPYARLGLDSATLHTFTSHHEAASKLLRHLPVKEMLKVYITSCGVSNVDAAAGW